MCIVYTIVVQIVQRKTHTCQQLYNGENKEKLRSCLFIPALPKSYGGDQRKRKDRKKCKNEPKMRY